MIRNENLASNDGEEALYQRRSLDSIEEASLDDSDCGSHSQDQPSTQEQQQEHKNEGHNDATEATASNTSSDQTDTDARTRRSQGQALKGEQKWHSGRNLKMKADSIDSDEELASLSANERSSRTGECWVKVFIFLFLSCATAVVAVTIHKLSSEQEVQGYHSRFDDVSQQILDVIQMQMKDTTDFLESWSLHMTSSIPSTEEQAQPGWPLITLPNFELQGQDALQKIGARLLSLCPIVSSAERMKWELYSVEQETWIQESLDAHENTMESAQPITPYIFRSTSTHQEAVGPLVDDKYLPMWQTAPIFGNQVVVNLDAFTYTVVPTVYERMMGTNQSVLSETINGDEDAYRPPEAFLAVPVFQAPTSNDAPIAAMLMALLQWEAYLINLIHTGIPAVDVVVRNPCVEPFTYRVTGPEATYVGLGDHHDSAFDQEEVSANLDVLSVEGCANTFHVYPTRAFENEYMTNKPAIYTGIAVALFLITAAVFCLYDILIRKQHSKIVKAANLSNALVRSLFPESVRSRLMGEQFKSRRRRKTEDKDPPVKQLSCRKIAADSQAEMSGSNDGVGKRDKPIADLFPHATVLFADIAGFTAWSSSREPSQVFTLLEGIYNSFDKIAARAKVFKVETIGDCYVAAAGLPDPRSDHAAAMARFTVMCMRRFREVVKDLEKTLGPDTADLAMRAGLHSGPVTAGVLRGEKSRFQLFGDTVNVASRMESTGSINQIHLSQTTADLVISECDELSIKPRDQLMEVKGKGKMQTYWLIFDNGEESEREAKRLASQSEGPDSIVRSSFAFSSVDDNYSLGAAAVPCEKQERLIDWNVDVLQGLLKKIVAMRKVESKRSARNISRLKIDRDPDKMVIDEVQDVIEIKTVKGAAEYQRDPSTIELESVVVAQLRDFATIIASKYRKNHFHSFEHASHVTQSVIKLLGRIVAPEAIDYDNLTYKRKENAVLHYYTHGITSDPLTQFSAALAALVHDVDHKGVPNATLVKECTDEARHYKNKSVAEQNSVDIAWSLLMQPEYIDLRTCIYNSRKELQRFRQLVVNAVMATDIVDKELKNLRNVRWDKAFDAGVATASSSSSLVGGGLPQSSGEFGLHQRTNKSDLFKSDPLKTSAEDMNRKATIVIEHLIQASDVSHTMQHWHVYQKWNQRLFFECYQAYLDGRSQTDPADGWYRGEMGFFDFYIIPLAKKLKECGVFGVSSDEFLQYAKSNRMEWEEKGEDLVEKYIAAYKEHVFGGFRRAPGPPP